ncbi:sulfatase [Microbacterium sp. Be9]|uniref:sulfatase family protein n=1 Tax=Microbacterium sp. Be9 TaxID=2720211 RepID=UPI0014207F0C|nr:sulfatase [Microbacterium sp. Be9]NIG66792.1 sulfatase-like hydrolase/transferase [Microbacterium sp. Be9]
MSEEFSPDSDRPDASSRRPNIVLVLTDDHAAHAIGAYGSVVNRTPRIDEIADRGWRFDNCFATNSLCSPSRASILTGTHSHVNGVKTLSMDIDAYQPTFITQLGKVGYRTAMIGKWHLGQGQGHNPEGFDYWDVLISQGEYHDPQFLSKDGVRIVPGYATDIITDLAINWVESLEGDEPWCMLVYHKAPHRPWEPDAAHAEMYSDPIPVPATFTDDYKTRTSSARRSTLRVADHLDFGDLKQDPPPGLDYEQEALWKYQRYMEDYLRCVASVDDNVGRLTDWLDARGEFDDTVMMYSSDQGFFLGDHGWFDKRFMYEESIRMPLVMSYPRALASGRVHDGIITNVDFARSILDAAQASPHPRMQGRSFWPDIVIDSTDAPDPEPPAAGFYYRYWEHEGGHNVPGHYGYRDQRYKIIYFYNDGMCLPGTGQFYYSGEWELYDLQQDPDELRNVFYDSAYREVRDRLITDLANAQRAVGDSPHPNQKVVPVPPTDSESS